MLKIKNISKSFGGTKALNNCSLSIKKNTITALIGPNGSGKTTLFNIISHLIKEDNGEIYLLNEKISNYSAPNIAKKGISRTFQNTRLFMNLTIKEHLEMAMNNKDESIMKSLFKPKNIDTKEIKRILRLVGLNKPLNTLSSDLSYGQKKLLDLAIALAMPHEIILLDEPVAGVNPRLRKEIKSVLRKLKKQGETILVIEHDMNFIMDLADEIFVLDDGKVIARGGPSQIQNNKSVLNAYLGED